MGKIDTKEFGNLCVNVATEYNDALLVVENNNIGWGRYNKLLIEVIKIYFIQVKIYNT